MAVVYSTSTVHPRDRIAYWREVVIKDLPRHEFHSHVGATFDGTIEVGALADMAVAVFECDPCEAKRTERDLARCYNDDFVLNLLLSGRMLARQEERETLIERGSFTLFDTTRACGGVQLAKAKLVILSIPRQALEARLGNIGGLAARAMTMRNPLAGLAAEFLALLPARLDALAGPNGSLVAEQALDLVALAFSSEAKQGGLSLSSPRAVALLRVKSAIERRLRDCELKPAGVAAEAGISVRYANALLSGARGSRAGAPDDRRDRLWLGLLRPVAFRPPLPRRVRLHARRLSPPRPGVGRRGAPRARCAPRIVDPGPAGSTGAGGGGPARTHAEVIFGAIPT